ncbi:MAG: dockerin type I repeat-containing protein [Ruminococcus sp.]|nr:dockerin type I repeat-containing protein [Ruminococcus sp.]
MKKLFSIILVLIMLASLCVINAGAIPSPHFYGDVNCDRSIDVLDATYLQRSLVKELELSALAQILADVDNDKEITVLDATMIQQREAKIIRDFNHDDYGVYTYIDYRNLTANFDYLNAMVGVPVTFKTAAYCDVGNPLTYKYEVYTTLSEEPIFVSELSENPEFTYTFENPGYYIINSTVYNIFGEWQMIDMSYYVNENTDDGSLRISAVNQNQMYLNAHEVITITADAYGGQGPYEYKFELDKYHNVQDFSEKNTFKIGTLPLGEYSVKVTVRDANGDEATSSYWFEVDEPMC